MGDPSTIVSLVCSQDHIISDEEVILACAALRLRHPLFASSLALIGAPHFTVASPMTQAHAVRAARAQIEFHAFDDQDAAILALRDAWLAFDPENALDVRERTCALWWGRDRAHLRSGKYILGLITTHFVTDNRRRLNIVRQFLELLASPGQAKAELDAYFSADPHPAPAIPIPTEQLQPKPSGDEQEGLRAKTAYDELVTRYADEVRGLTPSLDVCSQRSQPVSGLVVDGSLHAAPRPGMVRKVWSVDETARILRACKAHGVTVTHLVNVAGALAAVNRGPNTTDGAPTASATDNGTYCFDFTQAIDIAAKAAGKAEVEMETVVRVDLYPVILCVPRPTITEFFHDPSRVWEIARQFKEQNDEFVKSPYFWHFLQMHSSRMVESYKAKLAGRPFLPFMSSLGDLKTLLPARYPIQPAAPIPDGSVAAAGADIHVTDSWTSGRVDPLSLASHLFTFDDRLHLQCRYNVNCASDIVVMSWFDRLVEIVSRVAE